MLAEAAAYRDAVPSRVTNLPAGRLTRTSCPPQVSATSRARAINSSWSVAATAAESPPGGVGSVITMTQPSPGRGRTRMYAPPSVPGPISLK